MIIVNKIRKNMKTYDRYSQFRINNEIRLVPFGNIKKNTSDYYEVYHKGETRLDLLSYNYYKNPNYGWLILQANPEVGSMEYEIKDGSVLRIPYPLGLAIESYRKSIEEYYKLYGNE